MQIPYYYVGQFRKYLFVFADLFNGVQIARFNPDGSVNHLETIPILFPNQDKYFAYYEIPWVNYRPRVFGRDDVKFIKYEA